LLIRYGDILMALQENLQYKIDAEFQQ
jgi:hypothetical protein